jgi:hypothetical protein
MHTLSGIGSVAGGGWNPWGNTRRVSLRSKFLIGEATSRFCAFLKALAGHNYRIGHGKSRKCVSAYPSNAAESHLERNDGIFAR